MTNSCVSVQVCVRSDDSAEFGSYLCVRKRRLGQIDLRLLVLTQPSTKQPENELLLSNNEPSPWKP